jgi:hypothetical protein
LKPNAVFVLSRIIIPPSDRGAHSAKLKGPYGAFIQLHITLSIGPKIARVRANRLTSDKGWISFIGSHQRSSAEM